MYGIASLLDDKHYQLVENLWLELKARFGVGHPDATAYPHFSYHVAEGYDEVRLAVLLKRLADETAVFNVNTAGIGIFTGSEPVVYIPVARSPALTHLHQIIWPPIDAFSQGSVAYYQPSVWFPHITLGHVDINEKNLGAIIGWLNGQASFNWQIQVNNFSLIGGPSGVHQRRFRVPFTG